MLNFSQNSWFPKVIVSLYSPTNNAGSSVAFTSMSVVRCVIVFTCSHSGWFVMISNYHFNLNSLINNYVEHFFLMCYQPFKNRLL